MINGQTNAFNRLVNHDGIFDTKSTYYSTEELWFPEYEFSGPEYKQQELYKKWSPSTYVDQWETPMLIIHGEKDYRLPVTEGLSTFTALQRRKIPSRLLLFPDESKFNVCEGLLIDHWVLNQANLMQWYGEILKWVAYWSNNSVEVKGYLDARPPKEELDLSLLDIKDEDDE